MVPIKKLSVFYFSLSNVVAFFFFSFNAGSKHWTQETEVDLFVQAFMLIAKYRYVVVLFCIEASDNYGSDLL